jgi:uncharacterized membrane protein YjgN (DUF898 family)
MRRLSLAFTGSASELRLRSRRDVLINIVLGGLYTSVARRHTADYLASRTTLDGTPLAHVAVRKSRLPAIILVVAFIALRLANEFGEGPPLPLLVVCGVLLLPYLWGTVAARTLGAIRWRELSLSFAAGWREIYLASWPLFVLGGAWALAEPSVAAAAEHPGLPADVIAGALVAGVVAFPLLAALAFNYRRLRFTRTRVGDCAVHWQASFRTYLRLWVLTALAVLATAVLPLMLLRVALFGSATLQGLRPEAAAAVYAASLVLLVLLSTPARAWYEARVFVLAWDGVRVGERLRIACSLDARAFARMRTAAAWRTLLTLGRHRAQAVVQAYEAKLAALQVWET